jgi:glycosyltransferase involved in cell wall biosynthesis
VLLITPTFWPDVGGVETMLVGLCSYLAGRQHKVDVLTYNPLIVRKKAPFVEQFNEYVVVRRIPWPGRGLFNTFERFPLIQFFYLVPSLTLATLLFLLFSRRRPDVIHSFGLSGAFAGGLASRFWKIPCLVDMCTVYRLQKRPQLAFFARIILNWCNYVRGNNLVGKEELLGIGINPDKVGVIAPSVDESVFRPLPQEEARSMIGLETAGFVALFVGRMVGGKNVELAVETTRLIKDVDATFVFVGEGPLQHLVETAAGEDKRIVYVGNVKHEGLPYFYNAADILMCAAVDKELISFVGREALMCGLPILAPRVAVYFGIPYTIESNLFPPSVGRFFDPTAESLAACLEDLIRAKRNKGTAPLDRQTCRTFAVSNFSTKALNWGSDLYSVLLERCSRDTGTRKHS